MTSIAAAEPALGLRERKKAQTRRDLHRAALEIVLADGLDVVTVDAIAERAGVSQRTFFNYFATRDDAITGGHQEALERLRVELLARPAAESTTEALRAVLTDGAHRVLADPTIWRLRCRVFEAYPELRWRMLGSSATIDRALVDSAVERAGLTDADPGFLRVAVEAHAALGAHRAAMRALVTHADTTDIDALLDQAFALLPCSSRP